ncbi:hypothetical protein Sp245p_25965 (plasmid) [Azospirillum baldaniorum]|uniref:Uncharacterized protein n=1 Tax=Azospirillum baldaniorum TaxID=1064539 RepID=A0A9P1JZW1_9PROT|nr:hypothetical protein [Azospirillum baldaniorum]AWJ93273.1 hypothetical protein Sp245p_25965 [Azospirillum baldaniorum]TWA77968.1 hypothetical protein FBZ85_106128 [Azospirillum brasilense]CCD02932.1 protein of unknown function [Azospirillum baldaniorum]
MTSKPHFITLTSAGNKMKIRFNPACITTYRSAIEQDRIPPAASVVNMLDETIYVTETPEQIDALLGVTAAPAAPDGYPPVGSMVLVAGANSDISDTERSYGERMVIGYTPCGLFACFQKPGCWPYVERLANCHFKPLPAHPAIATGTEGA